MAGPIITAHAVIKGRDETGPAFSAVGQKIDALVRKFGQVGKAAAVSAQLEKMNAALKRTQDQLAGIDRLRAAEERLARLGARYAEQKAAAEQQASARSQAAAQRAATAYYKQLDAVNALKVGLDRMGVSVNRIASEEARLRGAVDTTSAAIARQNRMLQQAALAEDRRAGRIHALRTAGGMAGVAAAHRAARFARTGFQNYREFDLERRTGKAIMGLTDAGQEPLIQQAIRGNIESQYTLTQWLQTQRELAARGLTKEQVMGIAPVASTLGQALGTTDHPVEMPQAARSIEAAVFGFKRDYSTTAKAVAAATRTADLQVAASKASGMTPEDLQQLYKYGATPARLANVSEESLLAFGGIAKRSNIGGDEAGVAWRALMKNLTSPTREAREALLARGLNFKNYQLAPQRMDAAAFGENVAAQYGVQLNRRTQAGMARIFSDQALIADPAKFTPAVVRFLAGQLQGRDAKSLKSIAGMANRYRNASMEGVDVNRMMADLIPKLSNLQFANAMFGSRQGGRISAALSDKKLIDELVNFLKEKSDGRAKQLSDEKTAGFHGAVTRLEGAIENLGTNIYRAWDDPARGAPLTWVIDKAGKLAQALSELDGKALMAGSALGGIGALAAGGYGFKLLMDGFGLKGSALALTESAAALNAAAARLGAGGAAGAATAGGGAAAAGGAAGTVARALPLVGGVTAAIATMWPTKLGRGEATGEQGEYWNEQLRLRSKSTEDFARANPGWRSGMTELPQAGPGGVVAFARIPAEHGSGLNLARGGYDAGSLGAQIEASLKDLKATVVDPIDVTGKLDPVELKGEATVRVQVAVTGDGRVVNQFTASSGHIRAQLGTSMPSPRPGAPPSTWLE